MAVTVGKPIRPADEAVADLLVLIAELREEAAETGWAGAQAVNGADRLAAIVASAGWESPGPFRCPIRGAQGRCDRTWPTPEAAAACWRGNDHGHLWEGASNA